MFLLVYILLSYIHVSGSMLIIKAIFMFLTVYFKNIFMFLVVYSLSYIHVSGSILIKLYSCFW